MQAHDSEHDDDDQVLIEAEADGERMIVVCRLISKIVQRHNISKEHNMNETAHHMRFIPEMWNGQDGHANEPRDPVSIENVTVSVVFCIHDLPTEGR